MGVCMVRQKLGDKTFTNYFPADSDNAKAFADALMPGEYEILEKTSETGSDTGITEARKWSIMIRDEESHEKVYLHFFTSTAKTGKDIREALLGKTFDGVKADTIIVINARDYSYSSSSSDDSGDSEG